MLKVFINPHLLQTFFFLRVLKLKFSTWIFSFSVLPWNFGMFCSNSSIDPSLLMILGKTISRQQSLKQNCGQNCNILFPIIIICLQNLIYAFKKRQRVIWFQLCCRVISRPENNLEYFLIEVPLEVHEAFRILLLLFQFSDFKWIKPGGCFT